MIFKTYKVQYESAVAENEGLKKQVKDLTDKIALLEEASKQTVAPLITKEDLDKLTKEHAEFVNKNTELETKIKEMESAKADVDELASVKAEALLATVGVEKPVVAAEDRDESDSVVKFVNGYGGRTVFKK
jgi:cell division protein FtsB